MAQQTAVEWLFQQFFKVKWDDMPNKPIIFEQAKQMEKEQIMRANFDGYYERVHGEYKTVERYYKEKYGN